jgi:hypothetical protein
VDCWAAIVTARGENGIDFVSRFFAPAQGVPEDPVTGSAHCTLVPYWAKRLGKTAFEARQLSRRGGSLHCALNGDRVDRPHRTGLRVVANAAVDIQYSRDEAYLGHRRFVRTRLWKQVTDLGDLTFGLLPRNKEFFAECLASRVL